MTDADTARDERTQRAVGWLLASDEPAIRRLTRREVLHEQRANDNSVLNGDIVQALYAGQRQDGGFGVHPYKKWIGAHWRLVSLVELGIPEGEPRAILAADTVLDWLTGDSHRSQIRSVEGLTRRCASQEGNALAVSARLGLAGDPRVQLLAESLIEWQWPDGGWNCDVSAGGRRSSFHESLAPAWGLHEYHGERGFGGEGRAAPRRRAVPGSPSVSDAQQRGCHPPVVACPALSPLLALRHSAGAPCLVQDGLDDRSAL